MKTQFPWAGWLTTLSRKKAATKALRHQQDFADYGTAFGLDLSLTSQTQSAARIDSRAQTVSAERPIQAIPSKPAAPAAH